MKITVGNRTSPTYTCSSAEPKAASMLCYTQHGSQILHPKHRPVFLADCHFNLVKTIIIYINFERNQETQKNLICKILGE